ncbi:DUF1835 domain-containing protein [Salibacterium salarium]|uniref:DUF1835 domain-containing protein n=1 Tax=Salibacterium salarium TaxID=284579 RepID=A0A428N9P8_9BACI|nr:DUF1835 domain-containing protein [Salibacterium salarium]RSL35095.1 DUF1835 domain-containing protein [Salibacterium salarium]
MIYELKRILKNSAEDEVKSLLFQILLRINRLEETDQYKEEQFVVDLKKTYNDFLNYKRKQTDIKNNNNYKVVHILFGDSASGCLKSALKEIELQDEEKIIFFSDIFSVGPIWQLHEKVGLSNRYEWLKNHINMDDEILDNYQDEFNNTISEINEIPNDTPIIIWFGENAHEQTALRYVLYILKEKTNDILIMETTANYKNQFDVPETEIFPLHTGEISPDKLRVIYKKNRKNNTLTQKERKNFENEWEQLSTKKEVLRIWKNKMIHSVNESHYDDYLIDTLRKIHIERKNMEFIKSARLIGEVMGYLDQYIGDQFFEYRVRHLIVNGIFEIEGVPKALRFYSVRLKNK